MSQEKTKKGDIYDYSVNSEGTHAECWIKYYNNEEYLQLLSEANKNMNNMMEQKQYENRGMSR